MSALTPELELALCERARSSRGAERQRAFAELFAAMRAQIFAVCLNVTGSRADAEDATQETFLAVYQCFGEFRGDARLSTWAYRVAVRAALAVKARRRAGHQPIEEAAGVASRDMSPESSAHANREAARLRTALDALSADHRVVLALFAVEGMSHLQIAEVVGVPAGTVWSRLHTARKRLGELLGNDG